MGGAKVSDKIGVIESLMNVADCFLIGGGMAYTFLKAQGVDVGSSLVEDTKLAVARKMLERAKIKGIKFLLPVDHLVASKFDNDAEQKVVDNKSDWDGFMGLDIGEKTVELYSEAISSAKNVFWNGPMGVFEFSNYKNGTNGIAKALTESKAMTVVGGGDSLSAINQSGFADKVTHLSTGGGASLNFLEGADLPGLKALL